ncbi:uncharacterized protein [Lepeophtheirus salmonis]|uniref:uncharacterized protein n=1 Tax=Lepeophtheirus salmonis TaxID=72036 RepID=UPI001AE64A4F|nr:uncharacterized protein LOC121131721 [Lepeophtheirus salmonis]
MGCGQSSSFAQNYGYNFFRFRNKGVLSDTSLMHKQESGESSTLNPSSIEESQSQIQRHQRLNQERKIARSKTDVSSSQINFFKMLDEKIEKGFVIDEEEEEKPIDKFQNKNLQTSNYSLPQNNPAFHTKKILQTRSS